MTDQINLSVILKIQALCALRDDKGATEAEAANAAEKVQYLLAKYNLDMATVLASGGKSDVGSERVRQSATDRTVYKWRRDLMQRIGKVNFCHVSIRIVLQGNKDIFDGFEIIGRQANVVATRVMFDYLTQTIERLAREWATSQGGNIFAKPAILFREGCAERLMERLSYRYDEILRKQREEAEAAHAANAKYAGSTLPAVILADYAREEQELNDDMRNGYELGTTTRHRKEREARDAAIDALCKDKGCSWSVAWDVINNGMTFEAALATEAAHNARHAIAETVDKPETDAQRRKRQEREDRQDRRWERAYQARQEREYERNSDPGYRAGQNAGKDIGLDPQVDSQTNRRIGQ